MVSKLGLGTNPLGGMFEPVPAEEADGVIADALRSGVTLLDTAPVYGYGNAEIAIGRAVAGIPRDDFVVTTKVGRVLLPSGAEGEKDNSVLFENKPLYRGTPDVEPYWDFSYEGTMRSIEASLERMGLDRVDAVYVHDPDTHIDAAVEGSCKALVSLREQGVIGAVGAGSNSAQALTTLLSQADLNCVLIAGRFSLLDQEAEEDLFPLCRERGVSAVVGGVYNSGILCNPEPRKLLEKPALTSSEIPNWRHAATFNYTPAPTHIIEKAQELADVCAEFGVPLMAAAIQFPFRHPVVSTVLMGPRSRTEMAENVELFEHDVPEEFWKHLQERGLISGNDWS